MRIAYRFLIAASISAMPIGATERISTPSNPPAIIHEVDVYLRKVSSSLKRGTEQYYAVEALRQAATAFREGNYGIGSIVLLKWKDTIYEYRARNAMVSGYGLRDHAEARGLDRAIVLYAKLQGKEISPAEARDIQNERADDIYPADTAFLSSLKDGLHVYGTLEPCPMCMVMMLNVAVKSSKSLAKDGVLRMTNGRCISDGAALATAEKFSGAPMVWQAIRQGQGLTFSLYKDDKRLSDLALRIFLETRKGIDEKLAGQDN
jgi:tRNA(Arg) A34 adenosine deaminase TadA